MLEWNDCSDFFLAFSYIFWCWYEQGHYRSLLSLPLFSAKFNLQLLFEFAHSNTIKNNFLCTRLGQSQPAITAHTRSVQSSKTILHCQLSCTINYFNCFENYFLSIFSCLISPSNVVNKRAFQSPGKKKFWYWTIFEYHFNLNWIWEVKWTNRIGHVSTGWSASPNIARSNGKYWICNRISSTVVPKFYKYKIQFNLKLKEYINC